MSAPTDNRCPITVVTGFLGSGKTTMLSAALRHERRVGGDSCEAHREEYEVCLDGLLRVLHGMELRRAALRGELPFDSLDLHARDGAALADEPQRVEAPPPLAAWPRASAPCRRARS